MGRLLGREHASTEWGGGSSPVQTEPPRIVFIVVAVAVAVAVGRPVEVSPDSAQRG